MWACFWRFTSLTLGVSLIQIGWTTRIDWNNSTDDATVRAVSIATSEKWQQLGKERGLFVPFEFMNDASRDQSPLLSYGSENFAKLQAVSRKYDPDQIFQKLQNDGFLLSKAWHLSRKARNKFLLCLQNLELLVQWNFSNNELLIFLVLMNIFGIKVLK